jgi:hypothetical protein
VSSLRKLRALPWEERWLLVQASLLLPLTALVVHTIGVGRWQRVLARQTPFKKTPISDSRSATGESTGVSDAAGEGPSAIQKARVIAKTVRVAARHGFYHANCLEQSLVLWWLLARKGIESELRFGARKEDVRLEAHAWVECCGVPLNEAADVHEQFRPFEAVAAPVRAE